MNGVDRNLQGRRWNRARNRDRNEARYLIRERVSGLCSAKSTEYDNQETEGEDDKMSKKVRDFFNSVSIGSASNFSLKIISANYNTICQPHDPTFMSSYKINTLCTSRFGKSYANAVLDFQGKINNCTLIEYASLIGEYGVVSSLLAGGVNPFVSSPLGNERAVLVSRLVIKTLVADLVPSSLASYAIKCLVTMKMWSVVNNSIEEKCKTCHSDGQILLTFPSCGHKCCELCMWEIVVQKLYETDVGEAVKCPECGVAHDKGLDFEPVPELVPELPLTPEEKGEASLEFFKSLPIDGRELKKMPKRPKAKNAIHSSWHSALAPKIGSSQDVRKDKFNRYVDLGAIHHCRACLRAGVDVNMTNEYSQTPLYIASWRNHINVVKLLLEYGADPNLHANGGMTAFNAATENCHEHVTNLLTERSNVKSVTIKNRMLSYEERQKSFEPRTTTLLSCNEEHPGAGSYLIDQVIPDSLQHFLDDLFVQLPIAAASDVKIRKNDSKIPCSKRHYFCDSEGAFSKAFAEYIQLALNKETHNNDSSQQLDVHVFPHMRFLNYTDAGSALPPHVDLYKIDHSTGKRSTHSFLLYLRDCEEGGETALLRDLREDSEIMAKVLPRKGRLLLFPHACPHEGGTVISTPKILLRGEVTINF